ncbi:MAG: phosphoglucosamine mutase [Gemmatimonadetes bacterium]|nr:phosphoglucosamine mutase [Gemmatimonadota bacterium]
MDQNQSFPGDSGGHLMVSISGIRGVVGESLTPPAIEGFARAFGFWAAEEAALRGRPATIVIGRDSRPTGAMVCAAASAGLMAAGCEVIDIGLAPTPTIMLRVETLGAAGALAITASHNPAQWNALKLIGPRGMFLLPREASDVLHRHRVGGRFAPWNGVGGYRCDSGAIEDHIERILALDRVDVEGVKAAAPKVVLDCGRGAGGVLSPELLARLGCEVVGLDLEPDGHFTRNPEPIPENLDGLCRKVREVGADIGLAHDADVDRLAIVTDEGVAVGEECTLALAVRHVLELGGEGPVVTNLSTSSMAEQIARDHGVGTERTPVGEIHVAEALRASRGSIGGEGNGGVILSELHYTRDAPLAAALVLSLMARTGEKISALVDSLPRRPMVKRAFPLGGAPPVDLADRLAHVLPGAKVDTVDGVRLTTDEAWVHVRASNTEPILRVIGEAGAQVEELVRKAARAAGATLIANRE